jgi:hypothetical protein
MQVPPQKTICYTDDVVHERIAQAWVQLFGRTRDYGLIEEGEPKPRRRRRGPPPEDALVPTGHPKTPPLSSATALPLPEPENWDVDALGKAIGEE